MSEGDPRGASEGAGEVGNRRIAADDEIETLHDRCGVEEGVRTTRLELAAELLDGHAGGFRCQLLEAVFALQTNEPYVGKGGERGKHLKRRRAPDILRVTWIALPADTDLEPLITQPLPPVRHAVRFRCKIARHDGYGVDGSSERPRQAEQRAVEVETLGSLAWAEEADGWTQAA